MNQSHAHPFTPSPLHPFILRGLLLLWLLGGIWSLLVMARQRRAAGCLRRGSIPLCDPEVTACYRELCAWFGLRRPPRLLAADLEYGPLLLGIVQPVIVVPFTLLATHAGTELRSVLAHELAHRKRCDLLWNWLPAVAHSLFFFHPLVWLANREWRLAQEMASDEMAVQVAGLPVDEYGGMLVRVATRCPRPQRSLPAVGALDSPQTLERRLLAMRNIGPSAPARLVRVGLTLTLVGLAGILPWRLTAARPAVRTQAGRHADRTADTPARMADHAIGVRSSDDHESASAARESAGDSGPAAPQNEAGGRQTASGGASATSAGGEVSARRAATDLSLDERTIGHGKTRITAGQLAPERPAEPSHVLPPAPPAVPSAPSHGLPPSSPALLSAPARAPAPSSPAPPTAPSRPAPPSQRATRENTTDQVRVKANQDFTLAREGVQGLRIRTPSGAISVTGEGDRIQIHAEKEVRADDDAAARAFLKEIHVDQRRDGDNWVVEATWPTPQPHHVNAQVRFEVHIPRKLLLDAQSGFGSIDVRGLAEVHAHSGSGSITARDISSRLQAHSGFGSIRVEGCAGTIDVDSGSGGITILDGKSPVTAHTGFGSVEVRGVPEARLRTSSGAITVRDVPGRLDAHSGFGDIQVERCAGPVDVDSSSGTVTIVNPRNTVKARSGFGNIRVEGSTSPVDVESKSGTITIVRAQAAVKAHTGFGSIDAEMTGPDRAVQMELVTSSGSIDARVPQNASAHVEAHSSSGRIDIESLAHMNVKQGRVDTDLGDGKGSIVLRTGFGSIHVRRSDNR